MFRTKTQSIKALAAYTLVEGLQEYFVMKLEVLVDCKSGQQSFDRVEWFRDQGQHGGGLRYVANNNQVFNRASVNVSQVHYDDDINKDLGSATALSSIIHPLNPHAASIHMHISWTEMKNGKGFWRLMADLNPAIENKLATELFTNKLKQVMANDYDLGCSQGDKYFFIPALDRHRGKTHFYLEGYHSGNDQADFNLAKKLGESVIDIYLVIFEQAIQEHPEYSEEDISQQLAYHTLYLFQVLTLDRGTTSGLLVHDQNDTGIMGSLPANIDKNLLASWVTKLESPQDKLLSELLNVLPDESACHISNSVKVSLAATVREHYKLYPKALSMQAHGNIIPTTVHNHDNNS